MSFKRISFILMAFWLTTVTVNAQQRSEQERISAYAKEQMKEGGLPGMAIAVVRKDRVVYKYVLGYSDLLKHWRVSDSTLFEIGSNTKAITALGIQCLVKKGLIREEDDVHKYLPWFSALYKDESRRVIHPVITILNLLNHTSGIPFNTIAKIPADDSDSALEKLIRKLSGVYLDALPGEKFEYATVNYDILGLIIEKVTGVQYRTFITENVCKNLGIPFHFASERPKYDCATAYKFGFLQARPFCPPDFRGNEPAGYAVANVGTMGNWLKAQINGVKDTILNAAIEATHSPDHTVLPNAEGSFYAQGWYAFTGKEARMEHGGNNPGFSSYIIFSRKDSCGVAVMTNLNSLYSRTIASGIYDILQNRTPNYDHKDFYKTLDRFSSALFAVGLVLLFFIFRASVLLIKDVLQKRRKPKKNNRRSLMLRALSVFLFLGIMTFCVYMIPFALFNKLTWAFVAVWAPESLKPAIITFTLSIGLFLVYVLAHTQFKSNYARSKFMLLVLSLISGFANTLIIIVITGAISREDVFSSGYFVYLVFAIYLYVYTQKILRIELINLTNGTIHELRSKILASLLTTPYQTIESIERERVLTVLVEDTDMVGGFPQIMVTAASSIVTITCCFVYLGFVNLWAFLVSLITISISMLLQYIVGQKAQKVHQKARLFEHRYLGLVYEIFQGFKELKLNNRKNIDFEREIQQNCTEFSKRTLRGSLMFVNVSIIGRLLFSIVIGVVVLIFPLFFSRLSVEDIRAFVFIFLYLTGPVNGLLDTIPNLMKINLSWKRVRDLAKTIDTTSAYDRRMNHINELQHPIEIRLHNVRFSYQANDHPFSIGPMSCTFKSGEINFITGGNGSGKSTLAKLVCGLYVPEGGEIFVNNEKLENDIYSQYYSAIFSDFHIFDKLYGIEINERVHAKIDDYVRVLQLEEKMQIINDRITNINLSSGQKKRLALLMSYLEDKPIYLFDEWAADQDPEFRKFFYEHLLFELKKRNKCVIVISHDDRYYSVADQVIYLEYGKIKPTACT